MNTCLLLNFLNLTLCMGCAWAAVCRLHAINERVYVRVAVLYVLLFAGAAFSGLQYYIFGTFAGWADVTFSAVVCLLMWATMTQWRDGPPSYCTR